MSHGPLMFDVEGLSLSSADRERLRHPAAGGIILFARNYESPEQVRALIEDIHEAGSASLLIAVDQEGGRVQRFRHGFTELPPARKFGELYARNHQKARRAAIETGWLMAAELRTVGVDFSFAPVLDLETDISRVIGDRAFSDKPNVIGELAYAWSSGAREAGMPSVGKHFPGHGCVEADSHHELPIDDREFSDIWNNDLVPFLHMINNGLEGLMPAHVIYSSCDGKPAGYSSFWIKDVLRKRLGYKGCIFSDDLSMAAADVAGSYPERARAALEAGCDMVLVCNNQQAAELVLDELTDYQNPVARTRLVRMHGRGHLSMEQLREDPRWHAALEMVSKLTADTSMDLDLSS